MTSVSDTPLSLPEFLQRVAAVEQLAPGVVQSAGSLHALDEVRADLVGRQRGTVTELMRQLRLLAQDDRREAGRRVQAASEAIETLLEARHGELVAADTARAPRPDLSMPARRAWRGGRHALT